MGIVVATTPMVDKPQLLTHLSGFTLLLFSSVLLQHCTYSLFTATPSHLHGCQTLLVVGKDIQWPHQDMHIHTLSHLVNFTSYIQRSPTSLTELCHSTVNTPHNVMLTYTCMYRFNTVCIQFNSDPTVMLKLAIPHF